MIWGRLSNFLFFSASFCHLPVLSASDSGFLSELASEPALTSFRVLFFMLDQIFDSWFLMHFVDACMHASILHLDSLLGRGAGTCGFSKVRYPTLLLPLLLLLAFFVRLFYLIVVSERVIWILMGV